MSYDDDSIANKNELRRESRIEGAPDAGRALEVQRVDSTYLATLDCDP